MKKIIFISLFLFYFLPLVLSGNSDNFFIQNKGQWDSEVLFLARMNGLNAWITKTGVIYDFYRIEDNTPQDLKRIRSYDRSDFDIELKKRYNLDIDTFQFKNGHIIKLEYDGMLRNNSTVIHDKLDTYYNFFIGNDKTKWAANVPLFTEITVNEIYQGIDVRYYLTRNGLRYDFIINPGAEISKIRMNFKGQDGVRINSTGELILQTSLGDIFQKDLYAYQDYNNSKKQVECKFIKNENGTFGIKLSDYDKTKKVIIDPLIYSTFLGSITKRNGADIGYDIDVDDSECVYVCGLTNSFDFPSTTGAYRTTYTGKNDCFVTKFNPTGSAIIFSTYIGSDGEDLAYNIKIDKNKDIYIAGTTDSTNYPTTSGAFQRNYSGGEISGDCFITKLNSTGSSLIYSTYFGGTDDENIFGIKLDKQNNIFIFGNTSSTDFPLSINPYQEVNVGSGDGFISKINATGSSIIFSTFLGGNSYEAVTDMEIDKYNQLYFTGRTGSLNFPITTGAYQTIFGGGTHDIFVSKFDSSCKNLLISTFLGTTDEDRAIGIRLDFFGNVIIAGETESSSFPVTERNYQASYSGRLDLCLSKFDDKLSSLIFSSYFGGSEIDMINSIAQDSDYNIYVTGQTISVDFPVSPGAYQLSNSGRDDIFLIKFNPDCSQNIYSTYLGGSSLDFGMGVVVDTNFNVYLTGNTFSENFPVTNGVYQSIIDSGFSCFITKLSVSNNKPNIIGVNEMKFDNLTCETFEIDTIWIKTGSCDLNIYNYYFTGVNSNDFKILSPAFPISLSLNDSLELIIQFKPSLPGNKTTILNLVNNSNVNPYTINLSGKKDTISFKLKGIRLNTLEFGIICLNSIKDTSFNILNESSASVIYSCSELQSPFSYVNQSEIKSQYNINEEKNIKIRFNAQPDTGTFSQYIDVSDTCGKMRTIKLIAKVTKVEIDAGQDTSICYGSAAFIGSIAKSGNMPYTYKWNPAQGLANPDSATTLASPDKNMKYYLTVVDSAGCVSFDSVYVNILPKINVDAGKDILTCSEGIFKLNAQVSGGINPMKSISWSPTTGLDNPNSLNPNLTISQNGTFNYKLCVTDGADCEKCDSIKVIVFPAIDAKIIGDSIFCQGLIHKLTANPQDSNFQYIWSNGSNQSKIDVDKPGNYWVKISLNGICYDTDTIEIKTYPKSIVKLQLDGSPELCAGKSLNISTTNKFNSYNWSTGTNFESINVSNAGKYYVVVTDDNGCINISDTVEVTLVDSLKPKITTTNNGILCPDGNLILKTEYEYSNYKWNTGETTKSITITQAGKYWVHVNDDGGCEGTSEQFVIRQAQMPVPEIIGENILCTGSNNVISVAGSYAIYKWETGENTKEISVDKPGIYKVTVTDSNGCEGSSTITITEFKPDFVQLSDIDFGIKKLNSISKKSLELKNNISNKLKIERIRIKGLEGNTFTSNSNPVPPVTLNKDEKINIDIEYQPTEEKYYLDSLIIEISEPCEMEISLAMKGNASDSIKSEMKTTVWLPDTTANIGEPNFCIPLMAKIDNNETYDEKISYKAEIILDASIMEPYPDKGTIQSGKRTIELSGDNIQLTNFPVKIGEFCGKIFIGDRDRSPVDIIKFEWIANGIETVLKNGSITVSGVCQQIIGRLRLVPVIEFQISPNPVDNELVVSIKADSTFTVTEIMIYDVFGQKVVSTPVPINRDTPAGGGQLRIDVSGLASGLYFMKIGDKVKRFVKL